MDTPVNYTARGPSGLLPYIGVDNGTPFLIYAKDETQAWRYARNKRSATMRLWCIKNPSHNVNRQRTVPLEEM